MFGRKCARLNSEERNSKKKPRRSSDVTNIGTARFPSPPQTNASTVQSSDYFDKFAQLGLPIPHHRSRRLNVDDEHEEQGFEAKPEKRTKANNRLIERQRMQNRRMQSISPKRCLRGES